MTPQTHDIFMHFSIAYEQVRNISFLTLALFLSMICCNLSRSHVDGF